jgi:hypothetical protein
MSAVPHALCLYVPVRYVSVNTQGGGGGDLPFAAVGPAQAKTPDSRGGQDGDASQAAALQKFCLPPHALEHELGAPQGVSPRTSSRRRGKLLHARGHDIEFAGGRARATARAQ